MGDGAEWADPLITSEKSVQVRRRVIVAIAIVVLGLVARLPAIVDDDSAFHPTRQFRSALITDRIYVGLGGVASYPGRDNETGAMSEPILEPPIMEILSASVWRISGGKNLWVAKLIAAVAYLAGALFLSRELARWCGDIPALVGLGLSVSLPYGLPATASFQPDPPMVGLFLISVAFVLRWVGQERVRYLYLAAVLAGLASLVKPSPALMITGALVALWVAAPGTRSKVRPAQLVAAIGLLWVPAALWAGIGTLFGSLSGQASSSIIPQLLWTGSFWRAWFQMIDRVVGIVFLIVGIAVIAVVLRGALQCLFIGLLVGYVAFGLIFSYRTSTHDYYSLPLIPVLAFAVGAACAPLAGWLGSRFSPRLVVALPVVALLPLLAVPKWQPAGGPDRVREAPVLGNATGHSSSVLFLASDYGKGAAFFGGMSGRSFPSAADRSVASLEGKPLPPDRVLLKQECRSGYRWFLAERSYLGAHPELRTLLDGFPVTATTDHFELFDLEHCERLLTANEPPTGAN